MSKIAIPVADGFQEEEFSVPYQRLRDAGHDVVVFGRAGDTKATGGRGEETADIEAAAGTLDPADFDAVVIPGGHAPDSLRMDEDVVAFVKKAFEAGKTVAAICHGPQLLIDAEVLAGKTLTSWASIRKDLQNAGANWVDQPVVEDDNLITSRKPGDLDDFTAALLYRL